MKVRIPKPICQTIWKFALLGLAVGAVGTLFAVIEKDRTFFIMSVVLALFLFWKASSILMVVKTARYERWEGVVVSDDAIALGGRHRLIMDEGETILMIAGKPIAKPGEYVCLYVVADHDNPDLAFTDFNGIYIPNEHSNDN